MVQNDVKRINRKTVIIQTKEPLDRSMCGSHCPLYSLKLDDGVCQCLEAECRVIHANLSVHESQWYMYRANFEQSHARCLFHLLNIASYSMAYITQKIVGLSQNIEDRVLDPITKPLWWGHHAPKSHKNEQRMFLIGSWIVPRQYESYIRRHFFSLRFYCPTCTSRPLFIQPPTGAHTERTVALSNAAWTL